MWRDYRSSVADKPYPLQKRRENEVSNLYRYYLGICPGIDSLWHACYADGSTHPASNTAASGQPSPSQHRYRPAGAYYRRDPAANPTRFDPIDIRGHHHDQH